jgi:hypothetical protein
MVDHTWVEMKPTNPKSTHQQSFMLRGLRSTLFCDTKQCVTSSLTQLSARSPALKSALRIDDRHRMQANYNEHHAQRCFMRDDTACGPRWT